MKLLSKYARTPSHSANLGDTGHKPLDLLSVYAELTFSQGSHSLYL